MIEIGSEVSWLGSSGRLRGRVAGVGVMPISGENLYFINLPSGRMVEVVEENLKIE